MYCILIFSFNKYCSGSRKSSISSSSSIQLHLLDFFPASFYFTLSLSEEL